MTYSDITRETLVKGKQKYRIIKQQYFIDENRNKYDVDGKYVVLSPTKREVEVANMLGEIYGGIIKIIPVVKYPLRNKNP